MDIVQLCDEIEIQPAIKTKVLQFLKTFDIETVEARLKDFFVYEKMDEARMELCAVLGEDDEHIKILACMLQASVYAYDVYREKGISREIYAVEACGMPAHR